jgi:non-heme chloroperoxidase
MPHLKSSDGTQLYYEVHGSGPHVLLLLHGMGDARSLWSPLLQHLDPHLVRAIIVDWRGHDRSAGDNSGFTYAQLHQDLLAIADAAGIESCVVVGFSGSCKNAVWAAAISPERVRGLVLMGAPGLDTVPIPREALSAFAEALRRTGDLPPEMHGWFTEKIGAQRAAIVGAFARTAPMIFDASAELWLYRSVVSQAAQVRQPVLLIAGQRDLMYSPEFQRQTTLTQLPTATMTILDCGHFIPCEEPAAVAALIESFVHRAAGIPARPGVDAAAVSSAVR